MLKSVEGPSFRESVKRLFYLKEKCKIFLRQFHASCTVLCLIFAASLSNDSIDSVELEETHYSRKSKNASTNSELCCSIYDSGKLRQHSRTILPRGYREHNYELHTFFPFIYSERSILYRV